MLLLCVVCVGRGLLRSVELISTCMQWGGIWNSKTTEKPFFRKVERTNVAKSTFFSSLPKNNSPRKNDNFLINFLTRLSPEFDCENFLIKVLIFSSQTLARKGCEFCCLRCQFEVSIPPQQRLNQRIRRVKEFSKNFYRFFHSPFSMRVFWGARAVDIVKRVLSVQQLLLFSKRLSSSCSHWGKLSEKL